MDKILEHLDKIIGGINSLDSELTIKKITPLNKLLVLDLLDESIRDLEDIKRYLIKDK